MKNEYTASKIYLEKTCNQLTKEDIIEIMKDAPREDVNELKAMITAGKNDFSTIRAFVYKKYIKKETEKSSIDKNEFLQTLLHI